MAEQMSSIFFAGFSFFRGKYRYGPTQVGLQVVGGSVLTQAANRRAEAPPRVLQTWLRSMISVSDNYNIQWGKENQVSESLHRGILAKPKASTGYLMLVWRFSWNGDNHSRGWGWPGGWAEGESWAERTKKTKTIQQKAAQPWAGVLFAHSGVEPRALVREWDDSRAFASLSGRREVRG